MNLEASHASKHIAQDLTTKIGRKQVVERLYQKIPGFDYKVSMDGWVKPVAGGAGLMMTTNIKSGWSTVNIPRNGGWVKRSVHRLILEAFVGPCPDDYEENGGMAARFKDGNKKNIHLNNLCWSTSKERAAWVKLRKLLK